MRNRLLTAIASLFILSCSSSQMDKLESSPISEATIQSVVSTLTEEHGADQEFRITRGVNQTAELWRESDGTDTEFREFCKQNFIADNDEYNLVFNRLANNFEYLYGYMGRIYIELNRHVHEDMGPIHAIDQIFSAYNPMAHIEQDLYDNKLAFIVTLNFPHYTLEEKNTLGKDWSDREWSIARLGDMFTARVPSGVNQKISQISSDASIYISEYNIYADQLRKTDGEQLFPDGMKLLAHWNIRDEIKSNYDLADPLPKQEMLYKVMLRIINQDIPSQVINNPAYQWNPFDNTLYSDDELVQADPEGGVRYQHLLNSFNGMQLADPYYPTHNTYIKRSFERSMEIPMDEVKGLFREYAASPQIREVAKLVSQRLERDLRPFDLWYNGFVGRAGTSEEDLNKITLSRYPHADAMDRDLANILGELGFDSQMAKFLAERIEINAARGSGHAMPPFMRNMPSHLRTRIGADGMDYKGYNIAMHELGHNVEQTITHHKVDSWFLRGVPNTAFTEALAFMYQRRDLGLLGISQQDPLMEHLKVLDVFWDNYEMMGISLVDIMVWEWLYDNPNATAEQLQEAVISIAKEVWNEFYADVFGEEDVPILAIYSHMIQFPLYLMNYPYGRLIMFQLEDYIEGKNFADETLRIFSAGSITPYHWMERAVGKQISNQPILNAVDLAIDGVK